MDLQSNLTEYIIIAITKSERLTISQQKIFKVNSLRNLRNTLNVAHHDCIWQNKKKSGLFLYKNMVLLNVGLKKTYK